MRISTNTLFSAGQARISELQSGLVNTQQQIATGRRILTPADDPIGASQVLNLEQGQAMNTQFAANRVNAGNALREQEGVLGSLTDLVQDIQTLLVQAGNGSLDDAQRGYLAVELNGQIDQMLALANSKDGMGNFMFSGFQVGLPAYVKTATGAAFQGDGGQRSLQVDSSRRVTTSVSGQQIFEAIDTGTPSGPGTKQDIFTTLRSWSDALASPTSTPAAQAALAAGGVAAGNALGALLDRVLSARAGIGAQQKEIEALDTAGSARDVYYAQAKSTLQDLDYTQAISQFSQQQTTLEAALKSFKTVSQLSLFSLI
ncbi:MAG: flagellar hook-associated protein FlgL [Burkholderiaceae bacterium]|nr:flagellar hook-associated protein FlgL [Burkholderiaceae bacterium]